MVKVPGEQDAASVPEIVVVDDVATNLRLLDRILRRAGYRARPMSSPRRALEAIEQRRPDLILLDVDMPDMDGFELCTLLKANPETADVPVIFISALDGSQDKLRAFELGGVDYITKPFQATEVEARIKTHLGLRRAQRELEQSYQRLAALEELRESLTSMLVHDLRSPLNGLELTLEMLGGDPSLPEDLKGDVAAARRSTIRLAELVDSMLELGRLEAQKMPVDLGNHTVAALLHGTGEHLGPAWKDRRLEISSEERLILHCDRALTERVLANLVANALSFASNAPAAVRVTVTSDDAGVRFEVMDDGPGIPEGAQEHIFSKYGRVAAPDHRQRPSTGLGLAFCRLAIHAQGGEIGVWSRQGKGSRFWFTLPCPPGAPSAERGNG